MASHLLNVVVLVVISLLSSSAVKGPECLRGCLRQQVSCGGNCQNFIFGTDICLSMCSSWGIRCQTNCPEASVAEPPASSAAAGQSSSPYGSAPTCGRANFNRIVGGTTAGRCEYPWMVLIYNQFNRKICGGSIIGPRHILTASHCLFSSDESTGQYEKSRPTHLIVFSGSSAMPLEQTRPARGLKRNYVAEVITHPEYRPSDSRNDIAILRLRRDLPEDDCHVPVCLVNGQENPQAARGCRTMGWGKTRNEPDAEATSNLRWTSLSVVSDEKCRRIYGASVATSATLCAGGDGADSCSGDSGGPLVCRGTDGAFYQHGVVSLGLEDQCGKIAGLYTRVSTFLSWIKAHAA